MNRNALCACGSGKRFKHCCGKDAAPTPAASPAPASNVRFEALATHQAGALGQAESLYRRALEEFPGDIDCLHMLGVVQMERLRHREALELLWDAAEKSGWSRPDIRHNLGLVLGKLLTREANARQADLLAEFVAREDARKLIRAEIAPVVSVVIPAYNHARYVARRSPRSPPRPIRISSLSSSTMVRAMTRRRPSPGTLPACRFPRASRSGPTKERLRR